ncbi:MAG: hypothetical protein AAF975_07630, partial [Spirochaetota bacterium]
MDIPNLLQQYRRDGLESLLNIVLEPDEETWEWQLAVARQSGGEQTRVLLSVGIHPNDADGSSHFRYPDSDNFLQDVLEPAM